MCAMLISVPAIPGIIGSEVTTIPVRGRRENITKLCRVALVALPVLLSGTAAMASEDAHSFPGAMCQPANSADRVSRDLFGRMLNAGTSTQPQQWICPIPRDAVDTDNGVEFAQIIVTSVAAASCRFNSMRENGSTHATRSPREVVQGNPTTLLYATGNENIQNADDGYYFFECLIPRGQGVVMYRLDENNNDED